LKFVVSPLPVTWCINLILEWQGVDDCPSEEPPTLALLPGSCMCGEPDRETEYAVKLIHSSNRWGLPICGNPIQVDVCYGNSWVTRGTPKYNPLQLYMCTNSLLWGFSKASRSSTMQTAWCGQRNPRAFESMHKEASKRVSFAKPWPGNSGVMTLTSTLKFSSTVSAYFIVHIHLMCSTSYVSPFTPHTHG